MSSSQRGRAVLAVSGVLAVSFGLGTLLGKVSWYLWVVGLLGLCTGLVLGFVAVFFRVWLGLSPRFASMVGMASVPMAFATFLAVEDDNHLRSWREAVAEARAAELGLPPEDTEAVERAGGVAFLAGDAVALLDADLRQRLQADGFYGRLLHRLDRGIRVGGSFQHGRAIEVGRAGAWFAWGLEALLALGLVSRIVRKSEGDLRPE